MDSVTNSLGLVALLTLILAIARILSETQPWTKSFLNVEGFASEQAANPAPATLDKPLDSYAVLGDSMKRTDKAGGLTAESCFQADFAAQSAQTGNFIQRDNNYKHKGPDSCSAPRTEFVNSFYLLP